MQAIRRKRNYVKKKQSVFESMKLILNTLRSLNATTIHPISDEVLIASANHHAQSIQAMCWSRRAKFSDAMFQAITRQKTIELCNILIQQARDKDLSSILALREDPSDHPDKTMDNEEPPSRKQLLPPIATLMEFDVGGEMGYRHVFPCE